MGQNYTDLLVTWNKVQLMVPFCQAETEQPPHLSSCLSTLGGFSTVLKPHRCLRGSLTWPENSTSFSVFAVAIFAAHTLNRQLAGHKEIFAELHWIKKRWLSFNDILWNVFAVRLRTLVLQSHYMEDGILYCAGVLLWDDFQRNYVILNVSSPRYNEWIY